PARIGVTSRPEPRSHPTHQAARKIEVSEPAAISGNIDCPPEAIGSPRGENTDSNITIESSPGRNERPAHAEMPFPAGV
ncbi:hypothetical protein, partial [Mycobacterium lacus]